MTSFKAALKFAGYFLTILILVPAQCILFLIRGKNMHAPYLPHLFHKITAWIFQIKVEVVGTPVRDRQVLYMCNHISYLDIPVFGSTLLASFVAKKEVDSWPLFNILARLQQTAFIERRSTAIKRETSAIEQKLADGRRFIIFPEGTSSDGQQVWPFKSSLFSLAVGEGKKNITVQPVTLSIISVDGQSPDDQKIRETYAWHLHMTMPLAPHFWAFGRTSGAVLRLTFHEPLESSAFSDRKELARTCQALVASGLVVSKPTMTQGEIVHAKL